MFFLVACLLGYLGLRTHSENRWRQLERYADGAFLTGLFGMVCICALIAYETV